MLNVFVEITPFDLTKFEIDKHSGFLRVDRPQRSSSLPPAPYGFVPRSFCGPLVGALMAGAQDGDGDPLDICVLAERPISRAEILLEARVVGGIPMLDGGLADDKIVAVLASDELFEGVEELAQLHPLHMRRLRHYFATYKAFPGQPSHTTVGEPYGREQAERVVDAALADYRARFGG